MRKVTLLTGSALVLFSVMAHAKTGEFVNYTLDNSGDRSSSVIENGTVVFKIGQFDQKAGKAGSYQSNLHYDLNVIFIGKKTGDFSFNIPSEYFAPDFIPRLQAAGQMDMGEFKIKYLGKENVKTHTGYKFPNCDHILVYDIKSGGKESFESQLAEALKTAFILQQDETSDPALFHSAGFEDAKIRLHIAKGIPAGGAVQIDVSANVDGFDVSAGFDYAKQ